MGRQGRGDVMGGTADSRQTAGQGAPEDLVSVRAAAKAVGITMAVMEGWIDRGRVTVHPSPSGRRVSLAAVGALCALVDAQMPPEAHTLGDVARAVRLSSWHIVLWEQQGLLPSWRGPHGLLVREVDVRALAKKQGVLLPGDEPEE